MERVNIALFQSDETVLDLLTWSMQSNFDFDILEATTESEINIVLEVNEHIKLMVVDQNLEENLLSIILKYSKEKSIPLFINGTKGGEVKSFLTGLFEENLDDNKLLEDLEAKTAKYFEVNPDLEPKDYCRILMKTLVLFDGVSDDYFIQLPSGRYLKLFTREDQINEKDVHKYMMKGVEHLWLKKLTSQWLLKEFNKNFQENLNSINENNKVTIDSERPSDEDLREDQQKREIIDEFGLDEAYVDKITLAISKTTKKMKSNPKLKELFRKMKIDRKKGNYFNSHIRLLSTIVCALAKGAYFTSPGTLEKLIFVSYIHDIALVDTPELSAINSKAELEVVSDKIGEEKTRIILNHPQKACELLSSIPETPPDAEVIIMQHHENAQGGGFPNGIDASQITPLSALFIVAHDFVDYIINNKRWSKIDFLKKRRQSYRGSSFNKILDSIKKLEI